MKICDDCEHWNGTGCGDEGEFYLAVCRCQPGAASMEARLDEEIAKAVRECVNIVEKHHTRAGALCVIRARFPECFSNGRD